MAPIAATKVAAPITFTPGTVIGRPISGDASASAATDRSPSAIPRSRNSTRGGHAAIVSCSSSGGSSPEGHPRP